MIMKYFGRKTSDSNLLLFLQLIVLIECDNKISLSLPKKEI
jgi:hypothetical protein